MAEERDGLGSPRALGTPSNHHTSCTADLRRHLWEKLTRLFLLFGASLLQHPSLAVTKTPRWDTVVNPAARSECLGQALGGGRETDLELGSNDKLQNISIVKGTG